MSNKQSETNSTIPAVLYIRMSSSAQEASPEQQRDECRKLAEKNGYKIIREYFDSAISGADTKRRKQFLKMIKDAESQGGFSVILCWDQDRFGRFDMSEANYYWYRLREAGVMVQTVAQGEIKTTELADWLKASIAQHGKHQFLIDLSRNTLRGRQKAALAGKTISRPSYGYDRVFFDAEGMERHRARYGEKFAKPSAWTVQFAPSENTESVDVVKRLFHRYGTSDIGYGALALELNKAGVPSPAGGSWGDKTVRHILTNPVYVGDLVWGRTRQGKFHGVDENGDISEVPSQSVRKMPGAAPIVIHDSHIPNYS